MVIWIELVLIVTHGVKLLYKLSVSGDGYLIVV